MEFTLALKKDETMGIQSMQVTVEPTVELSSTSGTESMTFSRKVSEFLSAETVSKTTPMNSEMTKILKTMMDAQIESLISVGSDFSDLPQSKTNVTNNLWLPLTT